MYTVSREQYVQHQLQYVNIKPGDTILDMCGDQSFRAASTAASINNLYFYLGNAPGKFKHVFPTQVEHLFNLYKSRSNSNTAVFKPIAQTGDTIHLPNNTVHYIFLDQLVYLSHDLNFATSEFHRLLKPNGALILDILAFTRAELSQKELAILGDKPEGTEEAVKYYLEQRGFVFVNSGPLRFNRNMARASKDRMRVFIFRKA
jgi:SAM-dependent methyltransferase